MARLARRCHVDRVDPQPVGHVGQVGELLGGGFLKIIPIVIPTYAGMKTSFYAD